MATQAGDADIMYVAAPVDFSSQYLTADFSCNWVGGHAAILAMDWYGKATLRNTPMTNMTINDKLGAAIQNVDNFSFA
jgi:hypothetical protein